MRFVNIREVKNNSKILYFRKFAIKTKDMKKLLIALLFILCETSVVIADNFIEDWIWKEITCEITRSEIKSRPRSVCKYPRLFSDEQNIYIMSEANDYDNAQIIITDEQGVIVKSGNVQVTAEQVSPYYIGDLDSGEYGVRFVTEDFELSGRLLKDE